MIPEHEAEDLVIIQENTIDLLGINYYQPRRIMDKRNTDRPHEWPITR